MRFKTQRRGVKAFTLIEVVVIIAIIAIMAVMLVPALVKAKARAERIHCVNQLIQLGIAFRGFGIDQAPTNNTSGYPMQVSTTNGGAMEWIASGKVWPHFQALSNEINNPLILHCPSDKTRQPTASFTNLSDSNISYFIGADSYDAIPNSALAGDDNFTVGGQKPKPGLLELSTNTPVAWTSARHGRQGNILLGDGSVQSFSNSKLNQAFAATSLATNRLLMP